MNPVQLEEVNEGTKIEFYLTCLVCVLSTTERTLSSSLHYLWSFCLVFLFRLKPSRICCEQVLSGWVRTFPCCMSYSLALEAHQSCCPVSVIASTFCPCSRPILSEAPQPCKAGDFSLVSKPGEKVWPAGWRLPSSFCATGIPAQELVSRKL